MATPEFFARANKTMEEGRRVYIGKPFPVCPIITLNSSWSRMHTLLCFSRRYLPALGQIFDVRLKSLCHWYFMTLKRENLDMSVDPFTSRNPGFCFVDFSNKADAGSVLSTFGGKEFLGRRIKVGPGKASRKPMSQYFTSQAQITQTTQPASFSEANSLGVDKGNGFAFKRWEQREEAPSHFKDFPSRVFVGKSVVQSRNCSKNSSDVIL